MQNSPIIRNLVDFLFPRKHFDLENFPPCPGDSPALFDYQDPLVKDAIWQLKYKGDRELAGKFGELLADQIVTELNEQNVLEKVLLIPIPISDKRRFERGWNQTELICEAMRKEDERFEYSPKALTKVVHTESQTRSGRSERLVNLKDSIRGDTKKVGGKYCVLVDDVITTGATMDEAKRALKESGSKRVLCFAIAH